MNHVHLTVSMVTYALEVTAMHRTTREAFMPGNQMETAMEVVYTMPVHAPSCLEIYSSFADKTPIWVHRGNQQGIPCQL